MKLRVTLGFIVLGLLSCSEDEFDVNDFRDDQSITTLNGTWKVISFEDFNSQKVEFKTQENSWGYDIIVTFNDTVDPNEFSGRNTTNSVFGEFDYIDRRQFKLRRLGTTFVGQPEWADDFGTAVLDGNVTYKINTGRLRIYYDNKQKSVTLVKK
jgi:hypothetical protein